MNPAAYETKDQERRPAALFSFACPRPARNRPCSGQIKASSVPHHATIETRRNDVMRAQWFGNILAVSAILTLAMALAVADTGGADETRLAE